MCFFKTEIEGELYARSLLVDFRSVMKCLCLNTWPFLINTNKGRLLTGQSDVPEDLLKIKEKTERLVELCQPDYRAGSMNCLPMVPGQPYKISFAAI